MSGSLSLTDIRRRAEFVLAEARAGLKKKDQTVGVALRVISSFCCVGADLPSGKFMLKSKFRSAAAHEAILAATDKSWTRNMTNEHQDEIESVWQWIRTNQDSLTPEDIIERFRRYPIIVITKDEDKALRQHREKHND